MFLFFKNTVKKTKIHVYILPISYIFTTYQYQNNSIYVKTYLSIIIGGTQIITNKRKNACFCKIIHFSMQFSAIVNRFIVKT